MSDQPRNPEPQASADQLLQESKQLRRKNELLQERVRSHTDALRLTNEQLEVEIVERIKIQRKLQDRIAFDQVLTAISTQFIHLATEEIDEGINQALAQIATFTHYDRGYIYLIEENGREVKNTHHWCNPQICTNLQECRSLAADLFQNWMPQLLRQEAIYIQNITDVEQETSSENKILALQGIRSALILPLVYSKEVIGFFGLDSNHPSLPHQAEHIDPLKVMADIFVNAIMRQKTELDLMKQRNFGQQIMVTMGQGVTVTTVEGVFEYVNPAYASMLGYRQEAMIGKTVLEFTFPENESTLIQAQMRRLEGKTSSYETRLRKADGTPLYVLINGVPHYDHQGKIIGSIATITDLTERREAEALIEANAAEVKAIYQAAVQLFKPSNVRELAKQIASTAINELGFDACGVLLLQEPIQVGGETAVLHQTHNRLIWLAREGRYRSVRNHVMPLAEHNLVTTAVRQGKVIYSPDVAKDPRYQPDNTATQSQLVIPLRAYDRIIGAIDLQSTQQDAFDKRAQRIITVFAEHAGLAMETVRLSDELRSHTRELETQITERKKIEQALRSSELRYKQLVETATDLIYRANASGYFNYVNPVMVRTLGFSSEKELLGRHFSEFVHPSFLPKLMDMYTGEQAKTAEITYHEFIALDKNKEQIWLGQKVQAIVKDERIIGYQALARDVTKRRHAEDALLKRSEELNTTNAKLARALRTKDEFLANMSHELRTPLNAILGRAEILIEGIHGPVTEKQAASLRVIEESGNHLLELINDILDLAKIEAGKITLDIQPVAVAHLCESSLQFVRQAAHKKQIKLFADVDLALEVCQADERRLKQVLINLLSNAVKFTPVGGEVGLKAFSDAETETVQFQVWDTGIGIAPKDMEQLFKPFVQLDSSLARSHEGTGLGLSLVFRLTEMHGGSVTLDSEVGVGSRFTVTLPQRPFTHRQQSKELAEKDQQTYGPQLRDASSAAAHDQLILLVEDNEANIEIFAEYLQVWGYRVIVARSGSEALARAQEETPDLILMDVQLPEMDGLTAVCELRKTEAIKTIPIITLTALAMQGDKARCLAAGANVYLSKPVQLRQLVLTIDQLLAEQAAMPKEPTL
jgi:PAS domain S-box-containing protein